jgi:hypothetical protein
MKGGFMAAYGLWRRSGALIVVDTDKGRLFLSIRSSHKSAGSHIGVINKEV